MKTSPVCSSNSSITSPSSSSSVESEKPEGKRGSRNHRNFRKNAAPMTTLPEEATFTKESPGAFESEGDTTRAYDLAALKYWGPETTLNFPMNGQEKEIEEMKMSKEEYSEYLASLRRRSSGFSRGVSKHQEEAAVVAYDMAALEYGGANAVTNFDVSRYRERSEEVEQPPQQQEQGVEEPDDIPQLFHYMQLPLCVDNATMVRRRRPMATS
ncbi:putative clathrin assembly protein [Hibiscus syriacus]|uniref:Clathrin assembly protein n=1 Tax=Hibiscus syriacus TaxID=106335 RepID=A0A6A3BES4_HIBSY|nr:putative clathrin assembly protein [Hibiscus syriacus]